VAWLFQKDERHTEYSASGDRQPWRLCTSSTICFLSHVRREFHEKRGEVEAIGRQQGGAVARQFIRTGFRVSAFMA